MHHEAHPSALLLRQGLRPSAENRGRILRPLHPAPQGVTHDLLVMNHHPDLAPCAELPEDSPQPAWESRGP
jgi:hypothetical protein